MTSIEIDFDVFKELTSRRTSERETYNDVLRKLLKLDTKNITSTQAEGEEWTTKGVCFPNGTEFRATYRGKTYHGRIESGKFFVDGKQYNSPSPAAVAITGHSANGWIFWKCRLPGDDVWRILTSLRK